MRRVRCQSFITSGTYAATPLGCAQAASLLRHVFLITNAVFMISGSRRTADVSRRTCSQKRDVFQFSIDNFTILTSLYESIFSTVLIPPLYYISPKRFNLFSPLPMLSVKTVYNPAKITIKTAVFRLKSAIEQELGRDLDDRIWNNLDDFIELTSKSTARIELFYNYMRRSDMVIRYRTVQNLL